MTDVLPERVRMLAPASESSPEPRDSLTSLSPGPGVCVCVFVLILLLCSVLNYSLLSFIPFSREAVDVKLPLQSVLAAVLSRGPRRGTGPRSFDKTRAMSLERRAAPGALTPTEEVSRCALLAR